jgi:hypothetical protein
MCTYQFCLKVFLSIHMRKVKRYLEGKDIIKCRISGIQFSGSVSQNLPYDVWPSFIKINMSLSLNILVTNICYGRAGKKWPYLSSFIVTMSFYFLYVGENLLCSCGYWHMLYPGSLSFWFTLGSIVRLGNVSGQTQEWKESLDHSVQELTHISM